jgi:hypothetical protein
MTVPKLGNVAGRLTMLALGWVAITAVMPAWGAEQRERVAPPETPLDGEAGTLEERIARAEKRGVVPRKILNAAELGQGYADANRKAASAAVARYKEEVAKWEEERKRLQRESERGFLDPEIIEATGAELASRKRELAAAEARVPLIEQEAAAAQAQYESARANRAEAELRLAQLRARLRQAPKEPPASKPKKGEDEEGPALPAPKDGPPQEAAAPPPRPKPGDIAAIRAARLALARKGFANAFAAVKQVRRAGNVLFPVGKPEDAYRWSLRWLEAQRDASAKKEGHIAALQDHHERMRMLKADVAECVRDVLPQTEADAAEWYLLEAELWLAQMKALPRPPKKKMPEDLPGGVTLPPKPNEDNALPRPKKGEDDEPPPRPKQSTVAKAPERIRIPKKGEDDEPLPRPKPGLDDGEAHPGVKKDPEAEAPRPRPKPGDLPAIRAARLAVARKGCNAAFESLGWTRRSGNLLTLVTKPEDAYRWSLRVLEAQRDASTTKEDRIAALQDHHQRMLGLQRYVERMRADLLPRQESDAAEWYRLEAELWLAQANARPRPQKDEKEQVPGEALPPPKGDAEKARPRPPKQ